MFCLYNLNGDFMNKLVECVLRIESIIDSKKEINTIVGKGYLKKENELLVIYFTSDGIKYKYEYKNNKLIVYCNDSKYCFIEGNKCFGTIKNGDYLFQITTLTSKLGINTNCVLLDYELFQNDILIGSYKTSLIF